MGYPPYAGSSRPRIGTHLWRSALRVIVPPLAIGTPCALEQKLPFCRGAPLCASSCPLLLCTQAVEERFGELAGDLLTPTPIGVEGRYMLDSTGSAQVPALCMFLDSASRVTYAGALGPTRGHFFWNCRAPAPCASRVRSTSLHTESGPWIAVHTLQAPPMTRGNTCADLCAGHRCDGRYDVRRRVLIDMCMDVHRRAWPRIDMCIALCSSAQYFRTNGRSLGALRPVLRASWHDC